MGALLYEGGWQEAVPQKRGGGCVGALLYEGGRQEAVPQKDVCVWGGCGGAKSLVTERWMKCGGGAR